MGTGANYKAWLRKREVPSIGTTSHLKGVRIPRLFLLLSELETIYFFLLERQRNVIDIREQFPIMDVASTLNLCSQQGVRHIYRKGFPDPFTIDFLITELVDDREVTRAASIKPVERARMPDVQERLAIEYLWCANQNIPWTLVDTSKFTKTVLESLRFIRGWFQNGYKPHADTEAKFVEVFHQVYRPSTKLADLLSTIAYWLHVSQEKALNIFRYCAWSKVIVVNVERRIDLRSPVPLVES